MPGSSASATPSTRNWRTVRRIMFAVFAFIGAAALIFAIAGGGSKPSPSTEGSAPVATAPVGKAPSATVTGSSDPICDLLTSDDIQKSFGATPSGQSGRNGIALSCDYQILDNMTVTVSLNCGEGDASTQGSAEAWWGAFSKDVSGSVDGAKKATNTDPAWTAYGVRLKGGCLLAVYRSDKKTDGLATALKTAYDNEMRLKVQPEGTGNLPLSF